MAVNFEIKGMLARLLATEDLIIEHKKVETAYFNVQTRVLTLPMWEKATNEVYDMLVAHEVSHALYTPNKNFGSFDVPSSFINVVEDVRVEKLIKRRYMGISKTFYNGYKILKEEDFFQIEDENVNEMNLADKINLYFKAGSFLDIDFTEEEKEILEQISNIETFDETVNVSKKLYGYCKSQEKKKGFDFPGGEFISYSIDDSSSNGDGHGVIEPEDEDQEEEKNIEEENIDQDTEDKQENESEETQDEEDQEDEKNEDKDEDDEEDLEVKTLDSLEESIRKLLSLNTIENSYVEIPDVNLETIIVNNQNIHNTIEKHNKETVERIKSYNPYFSESDPFKSIDNNYKEFKRSVQKEINYLVKEFECRKSASYYSRSTTSSTGVLDCSKLHQYKYIDDIFKKVTTTPEGKNHGLIFVLDWSGSMTNVLLDTLKQIYSLVWFCKKVSIPFELYAFTCEWNRYLTNQNNVRIIPKPHYEKKEGIFCIDEKFSMLNFLTSNVNNSTLEQQMKNLWRVACNISRSPDFVPIGLYLSGTPLNESIVSLHKIIPDFRKKHKLEKVHCIVLTDGEANSLPYHVHIRKSEDDIDGYIGNRTVNYNYTFLRDRKLGTIYKFAKGYSAFTDALLKNLRDKFPDVSFIGMRIMNGRDAGMFIDLYCGERGKDHDDAMCEWKKNKSFAIKSSGYNLYFGISSNNMYQSSSFSVGDNANKSQIKSAFVKSLKTKKLNKKILNQFIQLIV